MRIEFPSFSHKFKPQANIRTLIDFKSQSSIIITFSRYTMYRIIQYTAIRAAFDLRGSNLTNTIQRTTHNISLATLHQTVRPTTETTPQLHDLRVHEHHAYQPQTSDTATQKATHNISLVSLHHTLHKATEPSLQLRGLRLHDHLDCQNQNAAQTSTSQFQKSSFSTSVKESKIAKELREARARAAAIGREMDFREVHGRPRVSRDTGIWEFPVNTVHPRTQEIMNNVTANAATLEKKVPRTEAQLDAVVRRGINPILSRVKLGTKSLCAADLDNIYNL
jgi:hypothetical protein